MSTCTPRSPGRSAAGRLLLAGCAALLLSGCASSKPLDPSQRAAPTVRKDVAWGPPKREDLLGSFASESITGEAAASLRRVYYVFDADGTYSGAALVQDGAHAVFQVLSGRWTLTGSVLTLGDDPAPIEVSAAPDRVRLSSEGGVAVLLRSAE